MFTTDFCIGGQQVSIQNPDISPQGCHAMELKLLQKNERSKKLNYKINICNDHTMSKMPVHIWSWKLSNIGIVNTDHKGTLWCWQCHIYAGRLVIWLKAWWFGFLLWNVALDFIHWEANIFGLCIESMNSSMRNLGLFWFLVVILV